MNKKFLKYPLPFIILLSIILRIPHLAGSFWMDEAAQALEVIRPFNQQLNIVADFQPPLLHFILHFAQYISHSEWFLRTIGALIPGILTIVYSYKTAEKLFSKKVAIISSLLLATSSFHIFFSQELRPYSLPTALALMSMYFFISFRGESKKEVKNFIKLTFANALGLYASYLYPFFMLAQIIYTILNNRAKKLKFLLLSFTISILAFFPLLPLFWRQLTEGGNVRTQLPGWDQVVSIPQIKAIPMVFGKLIFGILPIDLNPFIVITSLLIGLAGSLLLYKAISEQKFSFFSSLFKKNRTGYESLCIVMVWLLVPLVSSWIISFIVPVVRPKRLLFLLPALYILVAHLSQKYQFSLKKLKEKSIKNTASFVLISTLFAVNIVGTLDYYTNPKLQRENWRALHSQISKDFSKDNTILVYSFTSEFSPMKWYEQFQEQPFDKFETNVLYIEDVKDLANKIKVVSNYKTVLVFDYLRDLTDPNKRIETQLYELGYGEVGVLDYPNIGFVRIFMKPETLIGMEQ